VEPLEISHQEINLSRSPARGGRAAVGGGPAMADILPGPARPSPRAGRFPGVWTPRRVRLAAGRRAIRGLRELARRADGLSRRVDPWASLDEAEARAIVLNERDPDAFEDAGRRQAERLLPLLTPDAVVMDLGCGIGRVARHVAPHCRTLWAVDVSPAMLRLARARLAGAGDVRLARCTGTAVPAVATGTVDLAYSILTLQHVEREDAFLLLREIVRVLRPGGAAYLTFPNLLADGYLAAFVRYAETGEVRNPVRARFYTPAEAVRVVGAAGLRVQEVEDGAEIAVTCLRQG
jgi:SAM-dependent methyltransferase